MRQRLVQLAPHATFITLKGANHYPQIQFAAQVNSFLLDFHGTHKR
jgi:pimeloyl-ACP methyl ester carboxylesterase